MNFRIIFSLSASKFNFNDFKFKFTLFTISMSAAFTLAMGDNICTYSVSEQTVIPYTVLTVKTVSYTPYCSGWDRFWNVGGKCNTKYRQQYGTRLQERQQTVYKTKSKCCPGWQEEGDGQCTKACPHGKYGSNCTLECDCSGNSLCHHVTGVCQCKAGWQEPYCNTTCPDGTYGFNCSDACMCENNASCKPETGHCSCMPGWLGQFCQQPCGTGHYGESCLSECKCARNGTDHCDPIDGACICKRGWNGKICTMKVVAPPGEVDVNYKPEVDPGKTDQQVSDPPLVSTKAKERDSTMGLAVVVVPCIVAAILIIVVIIAVVIVIRRRKKADRKPLTPVDHEATFELTESLQPRQNEEPNQQRDSHVSCSSSVKSPHEDSIKRGQKSKVFKKKSRTSNDSTFEKLSLVMKNSLYGKSGRGSPILSAETPPITPKQPSNAMNAQLDSVSDVNGTLSINSRVTKRIPQNSGNLYEEPEDVKPHDSVHYAYADVENKIPEEPQKQTRESLCQSHIYDDIEEDEKRKPKLEPIINENEYTDIEDKYEIPKPSLVRENPGEGARESIGPYNQGQYEYVGASPPVSPRSPHMFSRSPPVSPRSPGSIYDYVGPRETAEPQSIYSLEKAPPPLPDKQDTNTFKDVGDYLTVSSPSSSVYMNDDSTPKTGPKFSFSQDGRLPSISPNDTYIPMTPQEVHST
ncbi:unnamed protein product [Owenia fusiformis]|uniref:Uncharacterized protein n=1 Tax=Owenia fusiformis TaxID=6347 RepID=A0A8J1TS77_OWEFU|nr:unnamed protein product [Owenia fusiformis]